MPSSNRLPLVSPWLSSNAKGAGSASEIELTATMRTEGVDRRVRGQTVRMLSADGGKNWTCKPGTMEPKNLPISCRD